jgi:hypothetical protein
MKAVKILLAFLNVIILTFYVVGYMTTGSGKILGSFTAGLIIGLATFSIVCRTYLTHLDIVFRHIVFPLGAVILLSLVYAIMFVVFAPDKNGKFWVSDEGKLITRSLND